MRKRFIPLILVLLSVSAGLFTGCSDGSNSMIVSVPAGRCDSHRITKKLNVSGMVELEDSGVYTVSTKLRSYRVKSLNVRSGDEVREGDIICEFDTAEIEKNIKVIEERLRNLESRDEQSINGLKDKIRRLESLLDIKLKQIEENRKSDQTKYDEAVQNYNTAKSELDHAENEYNAVSDAIVNSPDESKSYLLSRCEELLQTVSIKRDETETFLFLISDLRTKLDDYPYQVQIAKLESENEIAEIQLSIDAYQSDNDLESQLNELKEALQNSVVYAPCSGTVRDVNITSGQIENSGSLVTIVQMDKTVVRASLNDYDSVLVKEGMNVDIIAGSEKVNGIVTRINHIKGEDGFDVYIDIDDFENANIGMTVSNSIKLFDKDVLSVNRDALINDDGVYHVYVAVPQNDGTYIAEYKPVTIGAQDDTNAEICSGINKGDLVITENTEFISDGMSVNVVVTPDA